MWAAKGTGSTVATCASQNGHLHILKHLGEIIQDPRGEEILKTPRIDGLTPLALARLGGHGEAVRYLERLEDVIDEKKRAQWDAGFDDLLKELNDPNPNPNPNRNPNPSPSPSPNPNPNPDDLLKEFDEGEAVGKGDTKGGGGERKPRRKKRGKAGKKGGLDLTQDSIRELTQDLTQGLAEEALLGGGAISPVNSAAVGNPPKSDTGPGMSLPGLSPPGNRSGIPVGINPINSDTTSSIQVENEGSGTTVPQGLWGQFAGKGGEGEREDEKPNPNPNPDPNPDPNPNLKVKGGERAYQRVKSHNSDLQQRSYGVTLGWKVK